MLTHYCPDSRRCDGDRGIPDLLCIGHFHAAFIEVKTANDRLRPDQTTWMHALKAAGQLHYVVGPEALANGVVERILDYLATGSTGLAA